MIRRPEFAGIQYLRGVAALLVVIYHLSMQRRSFGPAVIADPFQSGVDIFFVISGFVMVYSTDAGRAVSAADFVRRRLIRIVPLYWALTLLMVAVLIVAPQFVRSSKLDWFHVAASFAFVPALNPATAASYIPLVTPGWTLNLEMAFYALFALAIPISRGNARALIGIVALPLVLLSASNLTGTPAGPWGFYANPITLEFVYGMILGHVFLSRPPTVRPLPGLIAAAVLFTLLLASPTGPIALRPFRLGLPALAIVALFAAMPLPRLPWLHRLGDCSYSLYLSHFFVLSLMTQIWLRFGLVQRLGGGAAFYCAGTIASVIVGFVCWRLIERPLTEAARRLLGQRNDPVPVSLR